MDRVYTDFRQMMPTARDIVLKLGVVLGLTMPGTGAMAEQALIVVNHAYQGAEARRDVRTRAEDVSETLFGLGYAVNRLENPDATDIRTALDRLQAQAGPVVIYFAGRSIVENGQTRLMTTNGRDAVELDDAMARAGAGTRDATLVFLDVCLDPVVPETPVEPSAIQVDDEEAPAANDATATYVGIGPVSATDGLFVASSMPVGVACANLDQSLTEVMLERLLIPGLDLATSFEGTNVATMSTLSAPFIFRNVESGIRLTADDYRMLDSLSPQAQARMLASWEAAGIAVDRDGSGQQATVPQIVTTETVVLTSPVRPVATGGATLAPVTNAVSRVQQSASLAPRNPTPVQVSTNTTRAVPGAGGLPRPSIIVGLIEPTEVAFPTVTEPTGPVSGSTIEYTDIAGRRALRDNDPELFATLVDGGAFDPPPAELVVALQTELQRMNCYNSGIDGAWGPGSRAAVGRYYEQLEAASPSQDADVSIFRQIMMRDDVSCPAQPVAQTNRTPTTRTTQPRTQPRTQPAQTQQQPTQQQQPSRTINRSSGTGIFR